MSAQGTESKPGFSVVSERLLRVCFDQITDQGSTLDYSFNEDDIEQWFQDASASTDEDRNYPWRHFFTEVNSGSWVLDTENLVEVWCATFEENHKIPVTKIEKLENEPQYLVEVDGGNRGIVKFNLHFDSEQLLKHNSNPRESQFLIGFDIPRSGIDRENVFPWNAVNDENFWKKVSDILIEFQGPPSEKLYVTNSYVAENMPGGPIRTAEAIAEEDQNLEFRNQPQLLDNIKDAGDELDVSSLDSAIEISKTDHLVICNCEDSNEEALHLHLVDEGETKKLDNNTEAAEIIETLESKVNNYNDLKDDRHNTGRFVKLTLALLTVGALPAINAVLGMITEGQLQLEPAALITLNIIFLTIVLVFFLITIQPMFEIWHFSWDQSEAYKNARARLRSIIGEIRSES